MPVPKKIALLVNPLHQKALALSGEVVKHLGEKHLDYTLFKNEWPQTLEDFSQAWIVGGDGTLNYFINQFPNCHLPIAIFKGGTGNDFQWMLYGDLSVEEQVNRVLRTKPKYVDAGLCNNRLFINGVGIGLDGKVVQDLLGKSKWNGKLSYYAVVLRNIFFYKEFVCNISDDTFSWGKKCLMVNVANGRRYGGGFTVNPKGIINDQLLDVNIIGHVSPISRFRFLSAVEKGRHTDLPMVTYVKTGRVHININNITPAHLDGEYLDASEFVIECLPNRFLFLY